MSMTKKNYDAIANAINETMWENKLMDPATIMDLIRRLIVVMESDNPRFDRARFIAACTKNREAA